MILDRVTFTGADDRTDPKELIPISREFPFVEWGILFSGSRSGVPRYPSKAWVSELVKVQWATRFVQLSAHLCGKWVRDLVLEGRFSWLEENLDFIQSFERIQLNFHAHHHPAGEPFLEALRLVRGKQFIFQMDGVNDQLWESVHDADLPGVPLFDLSGGAGILPDSWPKLIPGVYCGYAGGLGPENVANQVRAIAHVAYGAGPVWIDMETLVRSEDDKVFDLKKCRKVLEAVAPYIGKRL